MKKFYILSAFLCCLFMTATAQTTMNVRSGQVTYAYKISTVGDMEFATGSRLIVNGKAFNVASASNTDFIDEISLGDNEVADNTVSVTYSGSTASVVVAGNIASQVTVTASGAQVSVIQDEALQKEVTYTLSGSSTNGSFLMDGDYKANVVLNGLTLTNTKGAAIDIENGKAISVTLTGANTLCDAAGGSHSATLYIEGHPTFSGSGSLELKGLTKHAFASDEYVVVAGGTITVSQAATDGFHINERFQMDGGTLNITSKGDAIDVGFRGVNKGTKDQYERNGFLELNGGTIVASCSGAGAKALKADSTIVIAGATVTATTSADAYFDTTENDISSSSAVKPDGDFRMTSGTLTATSTGDGGKGINATGAVTISGGNIYVTTTGDVWEHGADDTKPQGIKSDANITISGGSVYVCAGSYDGKATAFKPGDTGIFTINGGTVMGIARKKTTVSTASTQKTATASSQKITAGQTYSLSGVSYTIPAGYNNTSANVIVSRAGL